MENNFIMWCFFAPLTWKRSCFPRWCKPPEDCHFRARMLLRGWCKNRFRADASSLKNFCGVGIQICARKRRNKIINFIHFPRFGLRRGGKRSKLVLGIHRTEEDTLRRGEGVVVCSGKLGRYKSWSDLLIDSISVLLRRGWGLWAQYVGSFSVLSFPKENRKQLQVDSKNKNCLLFPLSINTQGITTRSNRRGNAIKSA